MRHFGTVLAAAVVGPLAWILLATGQGRSTEIFASVRDGGVLDSHDFVYPVLVLAGAGLVLGLIATLRFSPLGAMLAGLGYAASYLGLLVNPAGTVNLLDHTFTVAGHQINLVTPVQTGTTLLLGSLLLVGVVSAHRWRRWPRAEEASALPAEQASAPRRADWTLGGNGPGPAARPERPVAEPEPATAGGSQWLDSLRAGPPDTPWR